MRNIFRLIIERKTLYFALYTMIFSVLILTVVYATLSTTLNINGQAEVSAASWDIYLDNVQLNSNSATSNVPTITDKTTVTFSTTLSKPGDYYEFSVDVVNNGSIDAMIDSVAKTPELSGTQKKYLNYIVEYQNGESITTKQLVSKNSYIRLKVKIEFRKDLTASDLPTTSETLDLSFTVNYVQSDDNNENIIVENNGKWPKVISGDLETVGSEVVIGDEHFYIISNTDGEIAMLAKYNLEVGNVCTSSSSCTPIENPSGIQDSEMIGYPIDKSFPRDGTTAFSSINYWSSTVSTYPAYVYGSVSTIYNYVENYRIYLESHGAEIEEARLISIEELELLGCSRTNYSCLSAPLWLYSVSYWSGSAYDINCILDVYSNGTIGYFSHVDAFGLGVRPVIVVKV